MRGKAIAWMLLSVLSVCLAAGVTEARGLTPFQPIEEPLKPLGLRPGGWIEPQYALGEVKVDEYTYPGTKFPLALTTKPDGSKVTTVTSNFGYRYLDGVYDEHFGVDLAVNLNGSPVYFHCQRLGDRGGQ